MEPCAKKGCPTPAGWRVIFVLHPAPPATGEIKNRSLIYVCGEHRPLVTIAALTSEVWDVLCAPLAQAGRVLPDRDYSVVEFEPMQ